MKHQRYDVIFETIKNVRRRVRNLEVEMETVRGFTSGFFGQPPSLVLLSVSEQRTLEVLKTLTKPTTAQEVATLTGRHRAVESMHLNELFRRNMLLKGRDKRRQYFLLKREYRDERQAVDN